MRLNIVSHAGLICEVLSVDGLVGNLMGRSFARGCPAGAFLWMDRYTFCRKPAGPGVMGILQLHDKPHCPPQSPGCVTWENLSSFQRRHPGPFAAAHRAESHHGQSLANSWAVPDEALRAVRTAGELGNRVGPPGRRQSSPFRTSQYPPT